MPLFFPQNITSIMPVRNVPPCRDFYRDYKLKKPKQPSPPATSYTEFV